jgi:hypothetical protein
MTPAAIVVRQDPGTARLVAGREQFSRAIRALLRENGWTHATMAAVTAWANPEGRNWLSTSQISYYRTQHNKILGPKPCDALGQLNMALAMLAGDDCDAARAMETLGKPPGSLRRQVMERPWFLRHPVTGHPMDAGDLFMVWIGRLVLTLEGEEAAIDAAAFSADVSRVCRAWLTLQGAPDADGLARLVEHYPPKAAARVQQLQDVVMGAAEWTAQQVQDELEDLAHLIGAITSGERLSARRLLEFLSSSRAAGRA